jgi:hypothetical protein
VSPAELAKGDAYFYGGDVNKWKKFVYAIKARSFAHLSNKSFYASKDMPDSVSNIVIFLSQPMQTTRCRNGRVVVSTEPITIMGQYRANIGAIRQTAFIADLLTGASATSPFTGVFDPRTPYLINENDNGKYRGVTMGQGSSGLVAADQPKNFWRVPFAQQR